MSLLILLVLVFLVFFLGDHLGSQSGERARREAEVIAAKANLDQKKHSLSQLTPPALVLIFVVAITVVIATLLGGSHDGDHYYHRHRH